MRRTPDHQHEIDPDVTYPILLLALKGVILTGVLLAIFQLFYNRSLWLDEASLALNILERSWSQLFEPLSNKQAAPIGFLLAEKTMALVFGTHEIALRLFPLICFIASIPLFYLFVKRVCGNAVIALMSVAILSITHSMIRYATEVKQYIVDVMVTVLLLAIVVSPYENKRSRILLLACTGCIALLFSHIGVIVLFVAGVYLLATEVYQRRNYAFIIPIFTWIMVFVFNYFMYLHDHEHNAHMLNSWKEQFMPLSLFSPESKNFWIASGKSLFGFFPGFTWYWAISFMICVVGLLFSVWRKKYLVLYFCITPFLIHLGLSAMRLYPFGGRLILYLMPLVILIYVLGIYHIFILLRRHIMKLPYLTLAFPVLLMFYPLIKKFPVEVEEIKQTLRYVEDHIGPGEFIYVYYPSLRALKYYQITGFTKLDGQIIPGGSHRDNLSRYENEVLNLNGKGWVLFSHRYPISKGYDEEQYLIDVLLNHGGSIIQKYAVTGSSCYYIDTGR